MTRFAKAALLFTVLGAASLSAHAGTTGSIHGRVLAPDGRTPVARAYVSVSSHQQREQTRSGPDGRFQFLSLAPDEYAVQIGSRYLPYYKPGVEVHADQDTQCNAVVRPALQILGRFTEPQAGLVACSF